MVNFVWLVLLASGIFIAAINGRIEIVTEAALDGAELGVKVAFGLIGVMTFWLGMMKLAEKAGLVKLLARLVTPITRFLFPSIPKDHPAMGAIVMNICANVFGLGNAATPMGLIAMQEMQKLNPNPKQPSDAMCTFLALNTSCITIVPATIIAVRMNAGSANPTEIVGTSIFATACGTVIAITADRLFRKLYKLRRGGPKKC